MPCAANSSLYIRPTLIGLGSSVGLGAAAEAELFVILSPTGPYYSADAAEIKPIRLLADPRHVRAWPGGCGSVKMGSNYAPSLAVADRAARHGCQQGPFTCDVFTICHTQATYYYDLLFG